jgi:hypothetical protein
MEWADARNLTKQCNSMTLCTIPYSQLPAQQAVGKLHAKSGGMRHSRKNRADGKRPRAGENFLAKLRA